MRRPLILRRAVGFVVLLAGAPAADAQPARMVEDIATAPQVYLPYSPPSVWSAEIDGVSYFVAEDGIHGSELWRSDGTVPGTWMVADICPGFCSSGIWEIVEIGDLLYFGANDATHGVELWRSDGTAEGTRLVRDIRPGLAPSRLLWLTAVGDTLFFSAHDGIHGFELWTSDGTTGGTQLVKDILLTEDDTFDSGPSLLINVSGTLFFAAGERYVRELWKSDGTGEGTIRVKALVNLPGAQPWPIQQAPIAALGDVLVFGASQAGSGTSLWRSDGTAAGTYDIAGAHQLTFLGNLVTWNGAIFFGASTSAEGYELWRTDGTENGTERVKDIVPGGDSSAARPLIATDEGLFLAARTPATGRELWFTDGTGPGTFLIKDILPGSGGGLDWLFNCCVVDFKGDLLFWADDGSHGVEPWKSDGTEAGTTLLKDVNPGRDSSSFLIFLPFPLMPVKDRVLFFSFDEEIGFPLWTTDGSEGGTVFLKDFDIQPSMMIPAFGVHFMEAGPFAGRLAFVPDDPAHGREPWVSDGTEAGTHLIEDLQPGFYDGVGLPKGSTPALFTGLGEHVFFLADPTPDEQWTPMLWRSDGSAQGTSEVVPFAPEWSSGSMTASGGHLYFWSQRLWKSDGTTAGTVSLSEPMFITDLTPFGDNLLFRAGVGLWQSDGEPLGTQAIREFDTGCNIGHPSIAVPSGASHFYLTASEEATGCELWRSDGTTDGTELVLDIRSGPESSIRQPLRFGIGNPASSELRQLVVAEDGAFFIADDGAHGAELWGSDGSAAGTRLLGDVRPGPESSEPRYLTRSGSLAFWVADDGIHGRELWRSDGTAAGTGLVKDIVPGPGSSVPSVLTDVNGTLYFAAFDPVYGVELWKSDGTAAGTTLVQDIHPGPGSSTPEFLNVAGLDLYFTATDGTHGFELWVLSKAASSPPLAVADAYQGVAGHLLSAVAPGVLGNDTEPDGEAMTAVLESGPSHAASFVLRPDGSFDYLAADGFIGTDSFAYSASDGTHASQATVVITIEEPPLLGATKTVEGDFRPGGRVTFTILLTNQGAVDQTDNPGDELMDVLPDQLELLGATASAGSAVADLATATISWNGTIPAGGVITVTIEARISFSAAGQTILNQGSVAYDGDANGSNESSSLTDDPLLPGSSDPTRFVVAGGIVEIPTLSDLGLLALILSLAALAVGRLALFQTP